MLVNGRPGLLMGDFNVRCETDKSTSIHSIMDGPDAQEWGHFETQVMFTDVWKWIKGEELGYTFQSAQYKDTWSVVRGTRGTRCETNPRKRVGKK